MSKPLWLRSSNVCGQLVEAHLRRQQGFLLEILRLLADLRESAHVEGTIAADLGSIESSLPSMLEDPLVELRFPVGAGCEDSPRNGESVGIEFKDRDVSERILGGVEELVIKDASRLAGLLQSEDPFLSRMLKGLRRLALDDVAQGFLPAIGLAADTTRRR